MFNFKEKPYLKTVYQVDWRYKTSNPVLGGDYMIPVCQDEILTRPGGTDFTLRLHVEIQFRPGKAGKFSTLHLFRFACIFFEFFFVKMSVYKIENPLISIDLKLFCLSCLVFSCVCSFS